MPRFLAVHALPEPDWRDSLLRLAKRASARGLRPIETFYARASGRGYTLYDAPDAASIARLHVDVALDAPTEILPAEQIFTELLAQPHRAR